MRGTLNEFKAFAFRGNLIELAVAVILGLAFNAVIQALANGILMQLIAAIFGQPNFNRLTIDVSGTPIYYGRFITALIQFLLVALALFFVVRAVNRLPSPTRCPSRSAQDARMPLLLHAHRARRDAVQRVYNSGRSHHHVSIIHA
jgi:large conductance mechanosensitive channel